MANLPQSAIDWTKYMQGLEGKANKDLSNAENFDLSNTSEKLSDSFLDKLDMDVNGVIDIPVVKGAKINVPCNGYLQMKVMGYVALEYVISEQGMLFYQIQTTPETFLVDFVRINKNMPIRFAEWQKYEIFEVKFFPLKGAIHA